jgi:2-polyprenyl-6-methoxyphenol 4-hydroxylase
MAIKKEVCAEKTGSQFDIVIIGGGMVGISLSLILAAQEGWKILLVEAQPMALAPDETQLYSASFDARSTALSWTSRDIYESINVWTQVEKHLSKINQIHVSDRSNAGLTRMSADETGVGALGYVVENKWLGTVLTDHLSRSAVEVISAAKVDNLRLISNGAEIELKHDELSNNTLKQKISADLVVIADGAESNTAKKIGIYSDTTAYGQTAIIANIQLSKRHNEVAYERFTDQGPMALLPLADYAGQHRAALIWVMPDEISENLLEKPDEVFLDRLQARFGYRLGSFKRAGKRLSYPLSLTLSNEQVRHNIVVMGNAAHSLHPVAGQGFNLSLRDASVLAEILNSARKSDESIGSLDVLERYFKSQSNDQRNTVLFSDGLTKFFSGSSNLAAFSRNSGLVALDLFPQVRQRFTKFGMGMTSSEAGHG